MRTHAILLFLGMAIAISSCTYEQYPSNSGRTIPIYTSSKNVEVFYADSVMPARQFVVAQPVELLLFPEIQEHQLTDTLESHARSLGLDGIIVNGFKDTLWEESDVQLIDVLAAIALNEEVDDNITVYESKHLSGTGIIYTDNLDQLNLFIQRAQVVKVENEQESFLAHLAFDIHGNLEQIHGDTRIYRDYESNSLKRLVLEQTPAWSYSWRNDSTLVRKRSGEKVIVHFKNDLPIEIAKIDFSRQQRATTRISCLFDNQGNLVSKIIRKPDRKIIKESFQYDRLLRLHQVFIELPRKNEQYVIKYEYFSNEDLDQVVNVIDP